jgi:hypothetical protein
VLTEVNGDCFRGNFADGKKDGFGMLEVKEDGSKYVGWWRAD